MAIDFFPLQSTDISGTPFHICIPTDEHIETQMSSASPDLHFYPMTSTESPPLSSSEIVEIEESEREFSAQNSQVYDNVADLISALHSERSRCQKESTE
jgi:hypothetical protein